jgi:hypothetical protein
MFCSEIVPYVVDVKSFVSILKVRICDTFVMLNARCRHPVEVIWPAFFHDALFGDNSTQGDERVPPGLKPRLSGGFMYGLKPVHPSNLKSYLSD